MRHKAHLSCEFIIQPTVRKLLGISKESKIADTIKGHGGQKTMV
jgi:hypothetical protein